MPLDTTAERPLPSLSPLGKLEEIIDAMRKEDRAKWIGNLGQEALEHFEKRDKEERKALEAKIGCVVVDKERL